MHPCGMEHWAANRSATSFRACSWTRGVVAETTHSLGSDGRSGPRRCRPDMVQHFGRRRADAKRRGIGSVVVAAGHEGNLGGDISTGSGGAAAGVATRAATAATGARTKAELTARMTRPCDREAAAIEGCQTGQPRPQGRGSLASATARAGQFMQYRCLDRDLASVGDPSDPPARPCDGSLEACGLAAPAIHTSAAPAGRDMLLMGLAAAMVGNPQLSALP